MSSATKPVAVVVGATSKWQSDGRNTHLVHGGDIDDSTVPVYARWGVGGAIAQQFAAQGFHVVLTTRRASNAHALQAVIQAAGGDSSIVEMDVSDESSVVNAFAALADAGRVPEVVVYNAGYLEGRDLPADQELLEFVPTR